LQKNLRQRVINGPTVHPGANSIRVDGQAYTKNLMYGDRAVLADDLKEGANSIRFSIVKPVR